MNKVRQEKIRIPRSLAGRGNVDLVFNADGKAANTVSINVPYSLSNLRRQKLDNLQTLQTLCLGFNTLDKPFGMIAAMNKGSLFQ